MANPIFNGDTFRETAYTGASRSTSAQQPFQPYGQTAQSYQQGYPAAPVQQGYGQQPGYGQGIPVEPAYDERQARPANDRLTFDDVMMKTATVFGILAVGVIVAYIVPLALTLPVAVLGSIAGLILGLVNTFKKVPSPTLIGLYAFAEGLFVGGWTRYLEVTMPGIGLQALLATASIFTVTLLLFRSGKVRATPKLAKFFIIATMGYFLFSILNLVLMLTGVTDNAWGLRGVEIAGIPLGVIIGLGVIVLAAISLIMDFDQIQGAINVGAPKFMAWTCAFGLLVTVVWLYMEVLRLLAILRGSDD